MRFEEWTLESDLLADCNKLQPFVVGVLELLDNLIVQTFADFLPSFPANFCLHVDVGFGHGIGDKDSLLLRLVYGRDVEKIGSANMRNFQLRFEGINIPFFGRDTELQGLDGER